MQNPFVHIHNSAFTNTQTATQTVWPLAEKFIKQFTNENVKTANNLNNHY